MTAKKQSLIGQRIGGRYLVDACSARAPWGRVKSRHFVQVFDLGKLDSGIPFLVMERLIGHDLATELESRGALPIEDAVDYGRRWSRGACPQPRRSNRGGDDGGDRARALLFARQQVRLTTMSTT